MKKQHGFTLLEFIAYMVLVVCIGAVAIPQLSMPVKSEQTHVAIAQAKRVETIYKRETLMANNGMTGQSYPTLYYLSSNVVDTVIMSSGAGLCLGYKKQAIMTFTDTNASIPTTGGSSVVMALRGPVIQSECQ